MLRPLKLLNQNQSRNFLANIITSNSNKSDFYNNCNSTEIYFDDDNHHILINSKYFNINEMNVLKTKTISAFSIKTKLD